MATKIKGKFAVLNWNGTVVPGVNYTLPITANVEDTSNFQDGRHRTPTLEDATGITFQLVPDDDANEFTNFTPGTYGTSRFYVGNGTTRYYEMVTIIDQVTPSNQGLNNTLRLDVTASLHGTITYPA